MEIQFKDKNVLISGASGNVGSKLAHLYSQSGAKTILLLDQEERKNELECLAEKIQNNGNVVKTYYADNTVLNEIDNVVKQIKADDIPVDILVNNAGSNVMQKAVEITEETWDFLFDLNIKGSFFLTQGIVRDSLFERKGNVIFISSQHAVVGNIMRAHYCASKSALLGLIKALTAEWSVYGVRVNAVSPTFIINEINEGMLMSPEYKRKYLNKIPLGKYATGIDIANAVLFLSSDLASMITGHNLIVDGGYSVV